MHSPNPEVVCLHLQKTTQFDKLKLTENDTICHMVHLHISNNVINESLDMDLSQEIQTLNE